MQSARNHVARDLGEGFDPSLERHRFHLETAEMAIASYHAWFEAVYGVDLAAVEQDLQAVAR